MHYWRVNGECYILTAAKLRLAGRDSVLMSYVPEQLMRTWPFTVPNPDAPMNLPSRITIKICALLDCWIKDPSSGFPGLLMILL